MKDYERLTERRYDLIIACCRNCPNVNNQQGCTDVKCYEIKWERLADLEDKIESGELCEREEVRKETAKEILSEIETYVKTVFKSDIPATATVTDCIICAKISAMRIEYGINKEK